MLGFDPLDPVLHQHIPTSASNPRYCGAEEIVEALRAAELQAALREPVIQPLQRIKPGDDNGRGHGPSYAAEVWVIEHNINRSCSPVEVICPDGGADSDDDCLANVDASLDHLVPPPRHSCGQFTEFVAVDALDVDDDGVLRDIQLVVNASGESGVVEVLRPRGAVGESRAKGGYKPVLC